MKYFLFAFSLQKWLFDNNCNKKMGKNNASVIKYVKQIHHWKLLPNICSVKRNVQCNPYKSI